MSLKETILSVLGANPKNSFNEVEVKFYKDCNRDGQHGMVIVSHRVKRLDHVAVPFLFPGLTEPPALTARVLADIESAGASQGYVVHCLLPETYGPNPAEVEPIGEDLSADIERKPLFGSQSVARTKVPAAQRAAIMHAGVSPNEVDDYIAQWRTRHPNAMSAMSALSLTHLGQLSNRLVERVARGFQRGDRVGSIDSDLNDIVHDFLTENNITMMGPTGNHLMGVKVKDAISLDKIKEGSTLVQIQTAERLMNEHFTAAEFDQFTPEMREELEMKVLMQVNNDTGRKLPQSVLEANVAQIIIAFRTTHAIKTA